MPLPEIVPPLPRSVTCARGLAPSASLDWLRAGWRDLVDVAPLASLVYGLLVFALSVVIIGGLVTLGADYVLMPALGGFMVVGPALAAGLYEKSRRVRAGEPVTLRAMVSVRARSPGQILFVGVILVLFALFWMRAAVLLYAMFFGFQPFEGFAGTLPMLFGTGRGLALLFVGSAFGALFAAFGFAISAFSIPMLLDERTDAFSAMGASMVLAWSNLPVVLAWGAIVMALFAASLVTGLVGLVVTFPLLGHATWHAYRAVRPVPGEAVLGPAIADGRMPG